MIRSTELALGSRLKLLSDSLFNMGDLIYRERQIPFQARWFPIVYVLFQKGPKSVTDLAKELGVTHSAISQMAKKIIEEGIVESRQDPGDDRRKLLVLSTKGHKLCDEMEPIWNDILQSVREVIVRAGVDLMSALAGFERELKKTSLDTLVRKRILAREADSVEIIEYEEIYRADFKRLNFEWLEKYFYVEEIDNEILSDPERHILANGGCIFFARFQGEIIGTSALIKQGEMFELAKMSVTEKYKGLHIGEKLALAAVEKARSLAQKRIFLETNSRLLPALNLYKKIGFRHAPYPSGQSEHYQRSDVYMVLELV